MKKIRVEVARDGSTVDFINPNTGRTISTVKASEHLAPTINTVNMSDEFALALLNSWIHLLPEDTNSRDAYNMRLNELNKHFSYNAEAFTCDLAVFEHGGFIYFHNYSKKFVFTVHEQTGAIGGMPEGIDPIRELMSYGVFLCESPKEYALYQRAWDAATYVRS